MMNSTGRMGAGMGRSAASIFQQYFKLSMAARRAPSTGGFWAHTSLGWP